MHFPHVPRHVRRPPGHLDALLDALFIDGIHVVDVDTMRFIDVNETACRTLGYTRDEFLQLAIPDIAPDADLQRLAGLYERLFNGQDNEHPARASRPYARDRAGFIFGEGAGMVVLETKADAEARGAEVLGVLAGYGMSSDGTGDMVCPTADGALMAQSRQLAIMLPG